MHHVPKERMSIAIDEAIRVAQKDGFIVFLEPTFDGNFFDAEIAFNACDGDERKEKALAYYAILTHSLLKEVAEIQDETVFQFDSLEDFIKSMNPKQKTEQIKKFLEKNNYILRASRRINIFQLKSL